MTGLAEFLRIVAPGRRTARNLTGEEAERAFRTVLRGEASDAQVAALLVALRWKGETAEELAAFGRAARSLATLPHPRVDRLVAIGTPHDGREKSPPVEATAALAAAACGARCLLVTDRAVPPKRGLTAADVFEDLGGGFTQDAEQAAAMLEGPGLAAFSAAAALPGLRALDRVRADLDVRTALHTVEKLLAPEGSAMLVGAASGPVLGIAADVLRSLGHRRAVVLQGPEGGVTPSLVGPTKGIEIDGDTLAPLVVTPADYGLRQPKEPRLARPGAPGAAAVARGVLTGETGPARDATLLGAALVLYTAGEVRSLAEGVDRAARALDEGRALAVLDALREI